MTVIATLNPIDGLVVAGGQISISCMINGANNLEARFNLTLTAQRNNTFVTTANDTHLQHSFIARVSDAGKYICNVIVTSAFLDGPIISNTTVTLIVQSKKIVVLIAICV